MSWWWRRRAARASAPCWSGAWSGEAQAAGIARLWLYTRRARPLYLRLGWTDAFVTEAGGKEVFVMRRDLD